MKKEKTIKEIEEEFEKIELELFLFEYKKGQRDIVIKDMEKIKQLYRHQILQLLEGIVPEESKAEWDNPPREIQDTDYKLGEKIGFNQCRQEIIKNIQKIKE